MAGGINEYGFAGGDPANYEDPFGLCTGSDLSKARLECEIEMAKYGASHPGAAAAAAGVMLAGTGAAFVGGSEGTGLLARLWMRLTGVGAAAGSIANGDFERTFETDAGAIRIFGEAVSEGKTLTLNNFLVYPDNASRLQSGVSAMREGFREIADVARTAGYDRVIVNFHRTSGATIGKIGQRVIDLTK